MPETTDCNLKKWPLDRGLPWSDTIATDFVEKGIECVEDLKLLPADLFHELFASQKFIVKQKAKMAYRELASEEFDFKRQAKRINLASEKDTDTPSPSAAKKSSQALSPQDILHWTEAAKRLGGETPEHHLTYSSSPNSSPKGRWILHSWCR